MQSSNNNEQTSQGNSSFLTLRDQTSQGKSHRQQVHERFLKRLEILRRERQLRLEQIEQPSTSSCEQLVNNGTQQPDSQVEATVPTVLATEVEEEVEETVTTVLATEQEEEVSIIEESVTTGLLYSDMVKKETPIAEKVTQATICNSRPLYTIFPTPKGPLRVVGIPQHQQEPIKREMQQSEWVIPKKVARLNPTEHRVEYTAEPSTLTSTQQIRDSAIERSDTSLPIRQLLYSKSYRCEDITNLLNTPIPTPTIKKRDCILLLRIRLLIKALRMKRMTILMRNNLHHRVPLMRKENGTMASPSLPTGIKDYVVNAMTSILADSMPDKMYAIAAIVASSITTVLAAINVKYSDHKLLATTLAGSSLVTLVLQILSLYFSASEVEKIKAPIMEIIEGAVKKAGSLDMTSNPTPSPSIVVELPLEKLTITEIPEEIIAEIPRRDPPHIVMEATIAEVEGVVPSISSMPKEDLQEFLTTISGLLVEYNQDADVLPIALEQRLLRLSNLFSFQLKSLEVEAEPELEDIPEEFDVEHHRQILLKLLKPATSIKHATTIVAHYVRNVAFSEDSVENVRCQELITDSIDVSKYTCEFCDFDEWDCLLPSLADVEDPSIETEALEEVISFVFPLIASINPNESYSTVKVMCPVHSIQCVSYLNSHIDYLEVLRKFYPHVPEELRTTWNKLNSDFQKFVEDEPEPPFKTQGRKKRKDKFVKQSAEEGFNPVNWLRQYIPEDLQGTFSGIIGVILFVLILGASCLGLEKVPEMKAITKGIDFVHTLLTKGSTTLFKIIEFVSKYVCGTPSEGERINAEVAEVTRQITEYRVKPSFLLFEDIREFNNYITVVKKGRSILHNTANSKEGATYLKTALMRACEASEEKISRLKSEIYSNLSRTCPTAILVFGPSSHGKTMALIEASKRIRKESFPTDTGEYVYSPSKFYPPYVAQQVMRIEEAFNRTDLKEDKLASDINTLLSNGFFNFEGAAVECKWQPCNVKTLLMDTNAQFEDIARKLPLESEATRGTFNRLALFKSVWKLPVSNLDNIRGQQGHKADFSHIAFQPWRLKPTKKTTTQATGQCMFEPYTIRINGVEKAELSLAELVAYEKAIRQGNVENAKAIHAENARLASEFDQIFDAKYKLDKQMAHTRHHCVVNISGEQGAGKTTVLCDIIDQIKAYCPAVKIHKFEADSRDPWFTLKVATRKGPQTPQVFVFDDVFLKVDGKFKEGWEANYMDFYNTAPNNSLILFTSNITKRWKSYRDIRCRMTSPVVQKIYQPIFENQGMYRRVGFSGIFYHEDACLNVPDLGREFLASDNSFLNTRLNKLFTPSDVREYVLDNWKDYLNSQSNIMVGRVDNLVPPSEYNFKIHFKTVEELNAVMANPLKALPLLACGDSNTGDRSVFFLEESLYKLLVQVRTSEACYSGTITNSESLAACVRYYVQLFRKYGANVNGFIKVDSLGMCVVNGQQASYCTYMDSTSSKMSVSLNTQLDTVSFWLEETGSKELVKEISIPHLHRWLILKQTNTPDYICLPNEIHQYLSTHIPWDDLTPYELAYLAKRISTLSAEVRKEHLRAAIKTNSLKIWELIKQYKWLIGFIVATGLLASLVTYFMLPGDKTSAKEAYTIFKMLKETQQEVPDWVTKKVEQNPLDDEERELIDSKLDDIFVSHKGGKGGRGGKKSSKGSKNQKRYKITVKNPHTLDTEVHYSNDKDCTDLNGYTILSIEDSWKDQFSPEPEHPTTTRAKGNKSHDYRLPDNDNMGNMNHPAGQYFDWADDLDYEGARKQMADGATHNEHPPNSYHAGFAKVKGNIVVVKSNQPNAAVQNVLFGIGIRERYIIHPRHVIGNPGERKFRPNPLVCCDDRFPGKEFKVKVVKEFADTDLAISVVDDLTFPQFKDITNLFLSSYDNQPSVGERSIFCRVHKGCTEFHTGMIESFTREEEDVFEDEPPLNNIYRVVHFGVTDVVTYYGDCGLPYISARHARVGQGFIWGLHIGGSTQRASGKTAVVGVTQEVIEEVLSTFKKERTMKKQVGQETVCVFNEEKIKFYWDESKNERPILVHATPEEVQLVEKWVLNTDEPHADFMGLNIQPIGVVQGSTCAAPESDHVLSILAPYASRAGLVNACRPTKQPYEITPPEAALLARDVNGKPCQLATQVQLYNDKVETGITISQFNRLVKEMLPSFTARFGRFLSFASDSEVMNGIPAHKVNNPLAGKFGSIETNTSAGLTLNKLFGITKKNQAIGIEYATGKRFFKDNRPGKYLAKSYTRAKHLVKAGKRPLMLFKTCVKQERLPRHKAYKGRTFECQDTLAYMLERLVLGKWCAANHKAPLRISCRVGINPYTEFDTMVRFHKEQPNHFAADWSRWDKRTSETYFRICLSLFRSAHEMHLGDLHQSNCEWCNAVTVILYNCVRSISVASNVLLIKKQGMPSGTYLTAPLNSLINEIILFHAYHEIMGAEKRLVTYNDFLTHVRVSTYGDDDKISVSDEVVQSYNLTSLVAWAASKGLTLDSAEKDGKIVPYFTEVTDISFISRKVTKLQNYNFYVGALKKESIDSRIFWAKNELNNCEGMIAQFNSALLEAALWNDTVYYDKYIKLAVLLIQDFPYYDSRLLTLSMLEIQQIIYLTALGAQATVDLKLEQSTVPIHIRKQQHIIVADALLEMTDYISKVYCLSHSGIISIMANIKDALDHSWTLKLVDNTTGCELTFIGKAENLKAAKYEAYMEAYIYLSKKKEIDLERETAMTSFLKQTKSTLTLQQVCQCDTDKTVSEVLQHFFKIVYNNLKPERHHQFRFTSLDLDDCLDVAGEVFDICNVAQLLKETVNPNLSINPDKLRECSAWGKDTWSLALNSHYHNNDHHPEGNTTRMSPNTTVELLVDLFSCALRFKPSTREAMLTAISWISQDQGKTIEQKFANTLDPSGVCYFAAWWFQHGGDIAFPLVQQESLWRSAAMSSGALKRFNDLTPGKIINMTTDDFIDQAFEIPFIVAYLRETFLHSKLVTVLYSNMRYIDPTYSHDSDKFNRDMILAYVWQWYVQSAKMEIEEVLVKQNGTTESTPNVASTTQPTGAMMTGEGPHETQLPAQVLPGPAMALQANNQIDATGINYVGAIDLVAGQEVIPDISATPFHHNYVSQLYIFPQGVDRYQITNKTTFQQELFRLSLNPDTLVDNVRDYILAHEYWYPKKIFKMTIFGTETLIGSIELFFVTDISKQYDYISLKRSRPSTILAVNGVFKNAYEIKDFRNYGHLRETVSDQPYPGYIAFCRVAISNPRQPEEPFSITIDVEQWLHPDCQPFNPKPGVKLMIEEAPGGSVASRNNAAEVLFPVTEKRVNLIVEQGNVRDQVFNTSVYTYAELPGLAGSDDEVTSEIPAHNIFATYPFISSNLKQPNVDISRVAFLPIMASGSIPQAIIEDLRTPSGLSRICTGDEETISAYLITLARNLGTVQQVSKVSSPTVEAWVNELAPFQEDVELFVAAANNIMTQKAYTSDDDIKTIRNFFEKPTRCLIYSISSTGFGGYIIIPQIGTTTTITDHDKWVTGNLFSNNFIVNGVPRPQAAPAVGQRVLITNRSTTDNTFFPICCVDMGRIATCMSGDGDAGVGTASRWQLARCFHTPEFQVLNTNPLSNLPYTSAKRMYIPPAIRESFVVIEDLWSQQAFTSPLVVEARFLTTNVSYRTNFLSCATPCDDYHTKVLKMGQQICTRANSTSFSARLSYGAQNIGYVMYSMEQGFTVRVTRPNRVMTGMDARSLYLSEILPDNMDVVAIATDSWAPMSNSNTRYLQKQSAMLAMAAIGAAQGASQSVGGMFMWKKNAQFQKEMMDKRHNFAFEMADKTFGQQAQLQMDLANMRGSQQQANIALSGKNQRQNTMLQGAIDFGTRSTLQRRQQDFHKELAGYKGNVGMRQSGSYHTVGMGSGPNPPSGPSGVPGSSSGNQNSTTRRSGEDYGEVSRIFSKVANDKYQAAKTARLAGGTTTTSEA